MKKKCLFDNEGFLLDFNLWDENMAKKIAQSEEIQIDDVIWKIIFFLRSYYIKFNKSPPMRLLVEELNRKFGNKIGNSIYLQSKFTGSPALQASKISGLPKPNHCI